MRFAHSSEVRPQVLLVEDDELLLEVMSAALRRDGYTFVTAKTGDEAIDLAYRLQPTIVLLDIDLPEQSGYLVAAKLKVTRPSPKVVFLTALPRGQSDRVAAFLRVEGILHKPFAMRKLLSTVSALLAVAQAA
jgi:DNA-binding response OmpR family regulator